MQPVIMSPLYTGIFSPGSAFAANSNRERIIYFYSTISIVLCLFAINYQTLKNLGLR